MNAFFVVSYVALWVLVVVLAVAVLALYNHFGTMYLTSREGRANQGPAPGTPAPRFTDVALDGAAVAVPSGRPALLLMASTDCPECEKLAAPLRELALRRRDQLDVVVLCGGPRERVAAWATAHSLDAPVHVVADRNFRRAGDFGVAITPFVVGVDGSGVVRTKGLVNGGDGLARAARDLLEEVADPGDGMRPIAVGGATR